MGRRMKGTEPTSKRYEENKKYYESHREELQRRAREAYHEKVKTYKLGKALKILEELKGVKLAF